MASLANNCTENLLVYIFLNNSLLLAALFSISRDVLRFGTLAYKMKSIVKIWCKIT